MTNIIKKFGVMACLLAIVSVASFTGCSGDSYSRSTGEAVDDAGLTAKVKTELLADPEVKGMDVKVDTFRGTVQLTGFVDTFEQKQRAEQLAREVQGVEMVRNDIIVKEAAGAPAKGDMKRDSSDKKIEIEGKTDTDVDLDRDPSGAELEVDRKGAEAEIEIDNK